MEKVWLKNYQKNVPAEINPDVHASIIELFMQSCQKFNNNTAYMNLGVKLTYAELEERSRAFAGFLQNDLGIKKGDRVAIMMPNLLQYPISMFAALRCGATIVNINPLYTASELTAQLKDSGSETLIVLANFAHVVEKSLQSIQLKNVIVTQIGDIFPFPKNMIVNFALKYVKKMVPEWKIPQAIAFRKALAKGQERNFNSVKLTGEDIAYLQYTGGTTGVAKAAVLTHRNMLANLEQASAWISGELEEGKEIIVTALPLYHIFSLTANCLTFMKIGATNVLITNPRDIRNFIKEITALKFTTITGVNTLFNALLNHADIHHCDFSALKLALGGGMAVQRSVADKWQKVTGVPLIEAYGLTETSPAVTINPLNITEFKGSVGLPISSTDIKIIDRDGSAVPVGEQGELCVKGPQMMREYWNKPEETKKVLSADGWLKTGDVAYIDQGGFVYLVDRIKDLIIVSGFNVYPNEVEDVIASHPGVLEVGVIGVAAKNSGEAVKAFVVKKQADLTEANIISHCRQYLTAYKVPKKIEFRDELPKTSVGKVLRRALRDSTEA